MIMNMVAAVVALALLVVCVVCAAVVAWRDRRGWPSPVDESED